ncbi:MAG: hypothetical protein ACFFBD_08285 [Candidatus Hodarchaeota archaeon]
MVFWVIQCSHCDRLMLFQPKEHQKHKKRRRNCVYCHKSFYFFEPLKLSHDGKLAREFVAAANQEIEKRKNLKET